MVMERRHKKTDLHITLDSDVVEVLEKMDVIKSGKVLRHVLFGEELPYQLKLGRWRRGGDLNPGGRTPTGSRVPRLPWLGYPGILNRKT